MRMKLTGCNFHHAREEVEREKVESERDLVTHSLSLPLADCNYLHTQST